MKYQNYHLPVKAHSACFGHKKKKRPGGSLKYF